MPALFGVWLMVTMVRPSKLQYLRLKISLSQIVFAMIPWDTSFPGVSVC